MELQHFNVKIFAEHPESVDQEKFTPVFHSWIQNQVTDELLLDVADYLHVEAGPGIVLVGYEADYSMDNTAYRLGLRYNRKAKAEGDNGARLSQALKAAFRACLRLESEAALEGKLRFHRDEIEVNVNDRALAPNTPETRNKLEPWLKSFFENKIQAKDFNLVFPEDPRQRFGATLRASAPLDFASLIEKL